MDGFWPTATTELMNSGPRRHSSRGFPTSHRIRPRYFAYLSAHALTLPAFFINMRWALRCLRH